jgi:transcriptional regulator with XRE-family HTH domain
METFENIKYLREKRGFSQEELATMVGYKDRSSIAKIEAGLVDLSQSKIAAFADALGVTPAQLMCIESTDGEPSPTKKRFNAFAESLSDEQMEKVMQIAKIALDR